jgi:hypothetical protein
MHVTMSVTERVWREFKAECFRRGLKASQLTENFMRDQLKKWGVELEDEPRKGGEKKR